MGIRMEIGRHLSVVAEQPSWNSWNHSHLAWIFRDATLGLDRPHGLGQNDLGGANRPAVRCGSDRARFHDALSRHGYRHGQAGAEEERREQSPYHLIDVLGALGKRASVAWWLEQAETAVREIRTRGKRILFVGGTALYLKDAPVRIVPGPRSFR